MLGVIVIYILSFFFFPTGVNEWLVAVRLSGLDAKDQQDTVARRLISLSLR